MTPKLKKFTALYIDSDGDDNWVRIDALSEIGANRAAEKHRHDRRLIAVMPSEQWVNYTRAVSKAPANYRTRK